MTDLLDRIVAKIDIDPDGCWNWTGAKGQGYGKIWAGRRSAAGHPIGDYAHRVVYEETVEEIAADLEIDHLCRNHACVNPDHLEPVTRRVNQLRGESPMAKQARQTHCKRGHPLDETNTYHWHGTRRCRQCNAMQQRARRS